MIGRRSISLELTADEQRAADADDALMEALRRMNAGHPEPPLPEGAIPMSELESACAAGHMYRVKRALKGGADPNGASILYGTVLHAAAARGRLEVVRILVDQGADPKVCDANGKTPAAVARSQKHPEVAAFLESAQ